MATDYITGGNVLSIKEKRPQSELNPTCSTMHTAKSYPFHFHLHMSFASSFTLTPQMWK